MNLSILVFATLVFSQEITSENLYKYFFNFPIDRSNQLKSIFLWEDDDGEPCIKTGFGVDEKMNIYLTNTYRDKFFILDVNGEVKKIINCLWPSRFKINDSLLCVIPTYNSFQLYSRYNDQYKVKFYSDDVSLMEKKNEFFFQDVDFSSDGQIYLLVWKKSGEFSPYLDAYYVIKTDTHLKIFLELSDPIDYLAFNVISIQNGFCVYGISDSLQLSFYTEIGEKIDTKKFSKIEAGENYIGITKDSIFITLDPVDPGEYVFFYNLSTDRYFSFDLSYLLQALKIQTNEEYRNCSEGNGFFPEFNFFLSQDDRLYFGIYEYNQAHFGELLYRNIITSN